MCGICGIFFKDKVKIVAPVELQTMIDTMIHRGPDNSGIFCHGPVGLGHRRLSIIDMSDEGRQPIYNENRSIVLVYNGEIYNYKKLRDDLLRKGHIFTSNTDSEVIVHLYEELYTDCVAHLRGMYAFAIWDSKRRELFIARDRIGIKPLYFCATSEAFIFASEIKAILATGLINTGVNIDCLDFYLSLGWVPGNETLFQGIQKVKPAYRIVVREGHIISNTKYWELTSLSEISFHLKTSERRLSELIDEVVESHLMSDVPFGAFLSGGIDSSVVVATMTKILDRPVKTFSVGYQNAEGVSELPYAKIVANHFNTEHHELFLKPLDFFESINKLLHFTEEPLEEAAGIALYQLSLKAKQLVTVLLSGEGMDEIMGGYPLYPKMLIFNKIHSLAKFLPQQMVSSLIYKSKIRDKHLKYLNWIIRPMDECYQSGTCRLTTYNKLRMYNSGLTERTLEYFNDIMKVIDTKSELRQMQIIDTLTWLPNGLLLKADKMTMAASIELRVPFLDHKIVEFCISLPDNTKLRMFKGKYLVKKLMKGILPDKILNRRKQGFSIPIKKWFQDELFNDTYTILTDRKSNQRGYFHPDYVKSLLFSHRKGITDSSSIIFRLLVLELWHRKYID